MEKDVFIILRLLLLFNIQSYMVCTSERYLVSFNIYAFHFDMPDLIT